MSNGASRADFALLMISAAPGIFWKWMNCDWIKFFFNKTKTIELGEFERGAAKDGQTRLEALIAHVCGGVRNFIVGVNKIDLFEGEAREARFKEGLF